MAVSFYVHAQKVVLSAYSIAFAANGRHDVTSKVQVEIKSSQTLAFFNAVLEILQVHGYVPWLNDILVHFSLGLQLCQQILDKVGLTG